MNSSLGWRLLSATQHRKNPCLDLVQVSRRTDDCCARFLQKITRISHGRQSEYRSTRSKILVDLLWHTIIALTSRRIRKTEEKRVRFAHCIHRLAVCDVAARFDRIRYPKLTYVFAIGFVERPDMNEFYLSLQRWILAEQFAQCVE